MSWIDPDESPRSFLIFLMAAGAFLFRKDSPRIADYWEEADQFVREGERRFGPLIREAQK